MFDLVADISAYPGFLPWCAKAEIQPCGDAPAGTATSTVVATLVLARGPLRKSLTTRNQMQAPEWIEMSLVRGPFRDLRGRWEFIDVDGQGTCISLSMEFEIANPVLRRTLGPLFGEIANTMVDAFCKRADAVFGAA
jgi:ribosome-associated toxin RatA of RatAB toxin-antitoxin module